VWCVQLILGDAGVGEGPPLVSDLERVIRTSDVSSFRQVARTVVFCWACLHAG
jgi:hypothetical protein